MGKRCSCCFLKALYTFSLLNKLVIKWDMLFLMRIFQELGLFYLPGQEWAGLQSSPPLFLFFPSIRDRRCSLQVTAIQNERTPSHIVQRLLCCSVMPQGTMLASKTSLSNSFSKPGFSCWGRKKVSFYAGHYADYIMHVYL